MLILVSSFLHLWFFLLVWVVVVVFEKRCDVGSTELSLHMCYRGCNNVRYYFVFSSNSYPCVLFFLVAVFFLFAHFI